MNELKSFRQIPQGYRNAIDCLNPGSTGRETRIRNQRNYPEPRKVFDVDLLKQLPGNLSKQDVYCYLQDLESIYLVCKIDLEPMDKLTYENPLISRYASRQMAELFGDQKKFSTWRRLWLALAESEKELGLAITDQQLQELRGALDDIDWEVKGFRSSTTLNSHSLSFIGHTPIICK